jgi:hypothetical protein
MRFVVCVIIVTWAEASLRQTVRVGTTLAKTGAKFAVNSFLHEVGKDESKTSLLKGLEKTRTGALVGTMTRKVDPHLPSYGRSTFLDGPLMDYDEFIKFHNLDESKP